MSWNAYCVYPKDVTLDQKAAAESGFILAASRVSSVCGMVDGHLREGGLCLEECAAALAAGTGGNVRPEGVSLWDWSPERVRELASSAQWHESADPYAMSAKVFVETCAQYGLGVRFSW